MKKEFVIETENLCKTYGKNDIVEDINMHIEKGKIYGLLGRNGVGKTTVMKMLLGLTSVSSGKISMFGKTLKRNEKDIYPRVGSLIEAPGFYPNLTGYENLKAFSILKGTTKKNAIENVLDLVNLPCKDKKHFSNYSLGMKQRLGLANALVNEPELVFLDEPTNGLDPVGIAELRGFIKSLSEKEGKTILLSSHQLFEVEQLVDTIGILSNKRLVEECDMQDIARTNQRYINIKVSDVNKTSILLEQKLGVNSYKVMQSDNIRIYDFSHETKDINAMLLQNGVDVSALDITAESLEEHFKMITGGVGIA